MGVTTWLGQNWFVLLQTVGIVASLLFTAIAFRQDILERQLLNLLHITDRHRDIWRELYQKPDLWRVVDPAANPRRRPVTDREELFVTLIILHLVTVHRAIKQGLVSRLGGVRQDIRDFFTLPLPKAVWQKISPLHEPDFVRFVEGCRQGE